MPIDFKAPDYTGVPREPPPSPEDWGPETDDLDESYAREIFMGKSVEQTFPLFDRSPIDRAEELRYMPTACFVYYLLAYRDYLLLNSTKKSTYAPDAASCFFDLIQGELVKKPSVVLPLISELLPTLEYLATHQDDFDADRDIYGDFDKKLNEITKLVDHLQTKTK